MTNIRACTWCVVDLTTARVIAVNNQPLRRRVPMKRHLLVALAAVLAVGISASAARAQCAFQHPKKAGKLQSNLIQAFVSCNNPGGNQPNNTTGGGIPSCSPPE